MPQRDRRGSCGAAILGVAVLLVSAPGLSVESYAVNPVAGGPPLALHISVLDRVPVPLTFGLVRESGPFGPAPMRRGDQVVASVFRPPPPASR